MAGILLSEVRKSEMNEVIDELVAAGDEAAVEYADDAVVRELARRWLATQIKQRKRSTSRAREQFTMVKETANARLRQRTRTIVEEIVGDLHSEWSASLLLGEFSLPDGTKVTWGSATITQHEARAEQLESLAAGDLQTASIHRRAIRDLRTSHARSLSEVAG